MTSYAKSSVGIPFSKSVKGLLSVLLLWLCLPLPGAQAKTYLVAIGNNRGSGSEPTLRFAEEDARRFSDVMFQLGRVAPEDGILMRGADAERIRKTLLHMNTRIRQDVAHLSEPSVLVVYYSGHADARGLHPGQTALGFDEVKNIVASSPAAFRLLVIDSCRSGGLTRVKGAKSAPAFNIMMQQTSKVEGLAMMTSSSTSEDAQESDQLRASFFTHHLNSGLRGAADRNRDGRVSVGEVYTYAYRETLRSSGRTWQLQHPTFAYDMRGQGEFTLTYLKDAQAQLGRLHLPKNADYLVFEQSPSGNVVAEVVVGSQSATLLLPAGSYFVQRRESLRYHEYRAELKPGDDIDLAQVPYQEVAYARLMRKGEGLRDVIHNASVMFGARSALYDGVGIAPNLLLGYSLSWPWLTLGLQLRGARAALDVAAETPGTQWELGLRLRAEHVIDFAWGSLSFGLVVEGMRVWQDFDDSPSVASRAGQALATGGLLAYEHALFGAYGLRVEGGPQTYILKQATTRGGAIVGDSVNTPLVWWLAAGLFQEF